MASGYNGRDLRGSYGYGIGGSAVYQEQRSDGGAGGLLKRSLTEIERQQQIQHALYVRSVKQRTSLSDLSSSISLSNSSGFNYLRAQQQRQNSNTASDAAFIAPADLERKSNIKNQLQELERQLLLDEEDDDDASVTGSAVTASELQQLISPPQQSPLPPSPTTSLSSTSSSSASCSPSSSTPLKQLLLDTAAAIAEGNFDTAAANIAVLKQGANPRGDPDQRLTSMMVAALVSRLNPPTTAALTSPIVDLCSPEHHMLYDASPCFKLALMAANFAILDTAVDRAAIHIVDFDFGGGQYASLISALAERSRHRATPSVRITAVCDPTFPFNTASSLNNLRLIGGKIATLGKRFGVPVRFDVVSRRAVELDRVALGCEPGEALAVNFAYVLSRIADESVSPANPRDELLRRVRSLDPTVVAVVEHEMNANTAPFAARFGEACRHYGAILESLDATSGRENPDRARVESCLGRKATNSIAREGADRIERPEVIGKWRARMSMAGLRPVGFGPAVTEPVKSHFGSMKANPGFTMKEEGGGFGFGFGWNGRVLTVASAWR